MIFAELQGKLGRDYSLAHDRAEDLLTSTVFQLLRYIPDKDGLLRLLRAARPLGGKPWNFDQSAQIEVQLWPRLGVGCCPDVLLSVKLAQRLAQVVLIEAKLFSGKTGRAIEEAPADNADKLEEDIEAGTAPISPDQLAR